MRLHERAKEVLLNRSHVTRFIDCLEAAELLCRRCPSDRRRAYAVLTEAGLTMRESKRQKDRLERIPLPL
jgi:DNA-binding MarR family transcriptional regulator